MFANTDVYFTAESPHLKSAIEQQKMKFLALNSEPKHDSSEAGATFSKHDRGKFKHEDKAGSSKEAEAEDNGTMNKNSVGESMQELKRMHLISPSVNPPAADSVGSPIPPKKVSIVVH